MDRIDDILSDFRTGITEPLRAESDAIGRV